MLSLKQLAILAVAVAVLWRPIVMPAFIWAVTAPYDPTIGTILPVLTPAELAPFYKNKRALVVGGTRGTGFGTAQALVKAGAHVTLVGRRESTGQHAVTQLQQVAATPEQQIQFQQGDIGSVRSTLELIKTLQYKAEDTRYDLFIVSAGIFPDWKELRNEDGLEKSYGIAVVGRFLLYKHMHRFLKPQARVLNILASGMYVPWNIDKEMAIGKKLPTNLAKAMINFSTAHEVMLVGLDQRDDEETMMSTFTRVSTHPGVVETQLHAGQGWFLDTAMRLGEQIIATSVEDCGLMQASILASDQLPPGKLSYVDAFGMGRLRSAALQQQVEEHLDWLWYTLLRLEQSNGRTKNQSTE
ncbi:Dehydrogenase [Seminavis robusta]|uniref:Dehydrogenase n=1 Tax=Seminavis robusta TaxID=568900 RepID=A0A9N8DMM4_9STRA|nr:Dehydrogenase [Seminavis robusta]|eukprot:Sro164_g073500.1 Dehydrogenase (355) ;mRNA; r:16859-17923